MRADVVLSKNPVDAVRRADSTLDARRGRDVRDRREPLLGSPRMSPCPHVFQFLVVAVAGWINRCFCHQLLLHSPYLILTKPLRLDIQCQRGASVKIGWKYLDD